MSILDKVDEFVNKYIKLSVSHYDRLDCYPKGLLTKLGECKFLGGPIPEEYGGLGLDSLSYGRFIERIGKSCTATRTLLTVHSSLVSQTILKYGSKEHREKYLPLLSAGKMIGVFALSEPFVGSDAKSIRTSYKKTGSKYVITGKKKWISFGEIADLFLTIAKKDDVITAFIIERDSANIRTKPIENMMAGRATHLAEIEFKDVEVAEQSILGKEGSGYSYVVNAALDYGRYCVAWGGLALAQEAVDAMVWYARKREQFGKRLNEFQLIRGMIGDAVASTHAARSLCEKVALLRNNKEPNALIETSIAKYVTSKTAVKLASDAVQIFGANGFNPSYSVERIYREAKVLEIIEGTSQIQQEVIANFGLNNYYRACYASE